MEPDAKESVCVLGTVPYGGERKTLGKYLWDCRRQRPAVLLCCGSRVPLLPISGTRFANRGTRPCATGAIGADSRCCGSSVRASSRLASGAGPVGAGTTAGLAFGWKGSHHARPCLEGSSSWQAAVALAFARVRRRCPNAGIVAGGWLPAVFAFKGNRSGCFFQNRFPSRSVLPVRFFAGPP